MLYKWGFSKTPHLSTFYFIKCWSSAILLKWLNCSLNTGIGLKNRYRSRTITDRGNNTTILYVWGQCGSTEDWWTDDEGSTHVGAWAAARTRDTLALLERCSEAGYWHFITTSPPPPNWGSPLVSDKGSHDLEEQSSASMCIYALYNMCNVCLQVCLCAIGSVTVTQESTWLQHRAKVLTDWLKQSGTGALSHIALAFKLKAQSHEAGDSRFTGREHAHTLTHLHSSLICLIKFVCYFKTHELNSCFFL